MYVCLQRNKKAGLLHKIFSFIHSFIYSTHDMQIDEPMHH